jgi:hypothetical protein
MLFYPYRKLFSSALHFAVPEEQTEHHAQTRGTTEKSKTIHATERAKPWRNVMSIGLQKFFGVLRET